MASTQEIVATGRRKTSVARVRMTAGSGKIDINGRSFEEYFPDRAVAEHGVATVANSEAGKRLRHLD